MPEDIEALLQQLFGGGSNPGDVNSSLGPSPMGGSSPFPPPQAQPQGPLAGQGQPPPPGTPGIDEWIQQLMKRADPKVLEQEAMGRQGFGMGQGAPWWQKIVGGVLEGGKGFAAGLSHQPYASPQQRAHSEAQKEYANVASVLEKAMGIKSLNNYREAGIGVKQDTNNIRQQDVNRKSLQDQFKADIGWQNLDVNQRKVKISEGIASGKIDLMDAQKLLAESNAGVADAKREQVQTQTNVLQNTEGLKGPEGLAILLGRMQGGDPEDPLTAFKKQKALDITKSYEQINKIFKTRQRDIPPPNLQMKPNAAGENILFNPRQGTVTPAPDVARSAGPVPGLDDELSSMVRTAAPPALSLRTRLEGATSQYGTAIKVLNELNNLEHSGQFGTFSTLAKEATLAAKNKPIGQVIESFSQQTPEFARYVGLLTSLAKFDRSTHNYRGKVDPKEVLDMIGTHLTPETARAKIAPYLQAAMETFKTAGPASLVYTGRLAQELGLTPDQAAKLSGVKRKSK